MDDELGGTGLLTLPAGGDDEPVVTPRRRRPWLTELLPPLVCLALVPVVHSVGPMLHDQYWLDEAWTALSVKAPLRELPWVTASTPLGWTVLLRLFPVGGQAARLLTLLFLAASVVGGYAFGRLLGWSSRFQAILAGLLGAAGALLLPAQQLRHDLKQYTADGALAVALLVMVAWAESAWSRRRGAVLCAAMVVATLFSHTALFVGCAALGGLLLVGLAQRAWRRCVDIVVLGAITGAGYAFVYLVIDSAGRTGSLYDYWKGYFPTVRQLPHYLSLWLGRLQPVFGLAWPLFILLALVGVVTVARLGRPATATAAFLLPVGLVAAGVFRLYPLIDLRTSHFLFVTAAVLAGVGVAGLAALAGRAGPARAGAALSALVAVLAIGGYAGINHVWLRYPTANYDWLNDAGPTPPPALVSDVGVQVDYVEAHRKPGDVVLVNSSGEYGFAYYWDADRPRFVRTDTVAIGWNVQYPSSSRIVIATDRTNSSIAAAVARARELAGGHQIWLVRSHVEPAEANDWTRALGSSKTEKVTGGAEPLYVVRSA